MTEIDLIKAKVEEVKKEGFGEVVVKIQNGKIHRIIKTTDCMIKENG